jgi:hypothetical protein
MDLDAACLPIGWLRVRVTTEIEQRSGIHRGVTPLLLTVVLGSLASRLD